MKFSKKILASIMSVCLAVGFMDAPAYAGTATVSNERTNEIVLDTAAVESTEVYTYVDSSFGVIIPKTIILGGTSGKGEYQVDVYGDIAADEYVSVVPDSTVTLSSKGKSDITAGITQSKTVFTYSDGMREDVPVSAEGSIQATGLTAGAWSGTFYFNINYIFTYKCYSSLELAITDANNLTTENADVKSPLDEKAVAMLTIENDEAYITMLRGEDDTETVTVSQPTTINLNSQTVSMAEGSTIYFTEDLTLVGGSIEGKESNSVLSNTSNSSATLTLSSIDLTHELSEDYTISSNVNTIESSGNTYVYKSTFSTTSYVQDETVVTYKTEAVSGGYDVSDIVVTTPKAVRAFSCLYGDEIIIDDCTINTYCVGSNTPCGIYAAYADNVNITGCNIVSESAGEVAYIRPLQFGYCSNVTLTNNTAYAVGISTAHYVSVDYPDGTTCGLYMMYCSSPIVVYVQGSSSAYTELTVDGGYYSTERCEGYNLLSGGSYDADYYTCISADGGIGYQPGAAIRTNYTNAVMKEDSGNLTVWGGNNAVSPSNGNVTIYGGVYKSPAHGGMYINANANVTIYDGLFYCNALSQYKDLGLYDMSTSTEKEVVETGEKLTASWSPQGALYIYSSAGDVNIYGGAYYGAWTGIRVKNYGSYATALLNLYGGYVKTVSGCALSCDSLGTINVYDDVILDSADGYAEWTSSYINDYRSTD